MLRFSKPLLVTLLAAAPWTASAQALAPVDHPGFALAEAVAAQGCVLHQDDVNGLLEGLGLEGAQFPQMAVPLMRDGYLRPSGEGAMTLINWGLCAGAEATQDGEIPPTPTE